MADTRFLIIHGHFYQPPRENPWTGLIAPEAGAAPFANWNERILDECYAANADAHVSDQNLIRLRNNYEELDFNFGPTLMSWLRRHGDRAYRAAIRADAASASRLGHGNAIAQAYNHSILPLLSARDREIQIAWGVEDFRFDFGRAPDGMWLPECAVDDDTLDSVAGAGLKFVIIGSNQGRFSGKHADGRGAGPFRWSGASGEAAVFRFDHELSRAIAHDDLLADGAALAKSITEALLEVLPDGALLLATDGEYFGHHHKRGADELARALALIERRGDIAVTNCAAYLAAHPVTGAFNAPSVSSWSCPHGIERWRGDCGCRLNARTAQGWRAPLHEAMESVKRHADSIYDRFAAEIVKDPFDALKRSIILAADSSAVTRDAFFERYGVKDESRQERLARLFEMQRAAHATLTSCAWFFDDFGGPEGRIALRYAARTLEIAAEFAPGVERDVLERLREARSNRRGIGDAARLYLGLKAREARVV